MKRSLVVAALLAGFFFFGCSKDNSIVDPVSQNVNSKISWLKLPAAQGVTTEAQLTANFDVNGVTGGYNTFSSQFPGSSVAVSATYSFPENCFPGQMIITAVFDEATAAADYYPSPFTFDNPITANITYSGLDLSNVDVSLISFVYLPPNSAVAEPIEYEQLIVDQATGVIQVVNAKIHHFSRYGFIDEPLDSGE